MSGPPNRWIRLLLPLLVAGCGAGGTPDARSSRSSAGTLRIDTLPGGRVVVENPAPRGSGGWALVEDLRLGSARDTGPEQFGQLYRVTTDASGRIYALDDLAQDIRVFDGDGVFLHRIGGKGGGPGEFAGAAGMNLDAQGRLWVYDPGNNRFSVFAPDGRFVESRPRRVFGVVYPWRGEFGPEGRLHDWGIDRPGDAVGRLGRHVLFYPIRMARDGAGLDTLPPFEYDMELTSDESRSLPFGAGLSVYQDRRGAVWFAHTREYTIYRRTLEGDTTLVFSLPADAAPVTGADLDSLADAQASLPGDLRLPLDEVPSAKPIVRRIFSDDQGTVYVVPELEGVPAGTVVDAFTEGGVFLARLETPEPFRFLFSPPHATPTHLYLIVTDELDVSYLSRLRIRRP